MKALLRFDRHSAPWLILGVTLWITTLSNAALWGEFASLSLLGNPAGWAFAVGSGVIIASALVLVFALFAWRWTLKPVLIMMLMASAFGTYFMLAYGIVIDQSMIVNVMQTDAHEAAALLSPRLALTLLALGVAPSVAVWRAPIRYGAWPARAVHNVLLAGLAAGMMVAAGVASFQPLSSTMRNHKQVRYLVNPLNAVYAVGYLAARPLRRDDSVIQPIGEGASAVAAPGGRPPLLVLVVGETARSGNFGLNGYARNTTPELARENVNTFTNAWACGTSTAASLPCMFSHLGRTGFLARTHGYEGLLDVVQRSGMAVLWLDNQSGCKDTCARVPGVTSSEWKHPTLCDGGECLDGVMLEGLDARIAALPAERRARGVLLVMHQMGSHGPAYWQRSPAPYKRFLPECTSINLQDCSRASLVNAYDNSIAYTDHMLASTIRWLRTRENTFDTAMVYVSDHGESLGENNLYLHGLPYSVAPDVQKHVPWITWLSPGYERRTSVSTACLAASRDMKLSHDFYFHSVLGLLSIRTPLYRRALDAYAPCASGSPA
ncbi:MAG: phosphoethanolamine--lipid A transferase [Comamonadaceae bacterium]|nr:MAG: phosphoethanolamine--lipid A transferase [Comamonadaceae bacterium]